MNIVQMYNDFPWLFKWVKNLKEFHQLSAVSKKHNWDMCTSLKESLDPQKCRCVVDAFLVHRQNLEVRPETRRIQEVLLVAKNSRHNS